MPLPRLRLPFMLIAAGLAAGCTTGADYRRPELPQAASYLHQAALGARQGADAADAAELRQWWTAFGDPRLTRLVTVALAQNLDLAQAQAKVGQARAAIGAADAALLPSASLGGQAARAYQSVQTPLGQVLNATPGYERSGSARELNLQASWELDLFGGLRREREAARADYAASEAGWAATRLAVAAQTADLYLVIQGLQARLELARRQVETQAALLEIAHPVIWQGPGERAGAAPGRSGAGAGARRRARPGHGARGGAACAGRDAGRGARHLRRGNGRRRRDGGRTAHHGRRRAGRAAAAPARPDRRRTAPGRRQRAHRRGHGRVLPETDLGALLGSATAGGALFGSGSGQAAGVLGLRWRLFDFGRIDAQIDASRGREAELLAAYRLAVLHATEDVENACSALLRHEEQATFLAQGVAAFERARAAALAAYDKGVTSRIEVLQAEAQLLRAADARTQAQTASARAAVATYRALGGGWQAPENQTEARAIAGR